ncbi:nicotinamide riboside transporter PnuC [Oleiagrimonas soli]|uniref:Nicotinamide riboside transporter PnuC n=1 Tax=Oleiagrimonas soli TaxID=1543381 RepID=A0A099CWE2_9GAMM|nr:nicotinamide riboside transporter PnuC [Oleiagrimonas soli]KGI77971.1 aminotransferase [Oleiagrimonas soli]MBB6183652.1 nicotinamide mononucleotide transporter [Oleiagrimonas soli]
MTWLELFGSALSIWAVWLTARRRMLSFPIGMLSVIVYAWIFVQAKLYSDTLLQVLFAGFIVYGWVRWMRNLDDDGRVRIAPLPLRRARNSVAVGVLGAVLLGWSMHRYTDAALPWLDAALTAFSLVAQYWQDRRHTAAWWLWIVVDTIYIGEYVYKNLYITSALYAVFVGLAVMGLRAWQQAGRDALLQPS